MEDCSTLIKTIVLAEQVFLFLMIRMKFHLKKKKNTR
jgi:hypothetical protein